MRREEEMRDLMEQQKMDMNNFNTIINLNETASNQLHDRYNESVKDRNERGIRLIMRSEEVAIVCEKSNGQEALIKNGNIELLAREEEIRFLKLRLEEEKRRLGLFQKQVPHEEAAQRELESLRNQASW